MLDLVKITSDRQFVETGITHGNDDGYYWSVVDPERHPLSVWKKQGRYSRTAKNLNAAVFTNGPLIGKRVLGYKLTRKLVGFVVPMSLIFGAVIGFVFGGNIGILLGLLTSITIAWTASFTKWIPCGGIHGNKIDDWRNFDSEGQQWAWLGRFGEDFTSYRIGSGDLPKTVCEGMGGLVLLVSNYGLAQRDHHWLRPGVVAWGLVPAHGTIVVIGSRIHDCNGIAEMFRAIGASDAVATDLRGCSMMGTGRTFMIAPNHWYREAMQSYGLFCR